MDKESISKLFNKMALIKVKIKKLERTYYDLETEAINESDIDTFEHKKGKFTNTTRTTYCVTDKAGLIKEMGTKNYKEYSTISKTNIIKCIGEKGFKKMCERSFVGVSNVSSFFVFRHAKT